MSRRLLSEMPDVMTEAELCELLGMKPTWCYWQRYKANKHRVAANLPPEMTGITPRRYRKVDVEKWIATGSRVPARIGRVA